MKYRSLLTLCVLSFAQPMLASEHDRNLEILDTIPLIEGYESPKSNEKKITDNLTNIFASFAERNKNSDGSLNRGTHAKGQCFDAETEVFSSADLMESFEYSQELATKIKQGFFKHDGIYPTQIRLANANGVGKKQDDKTGDVRGLSFSIFSDLIEDFAGRGRQDFMMNSTPGFSNGSIQGFYELVKTANIFAYKDFTYLPNPFYMSEIAGGLKAIGEANEAQSEISSFADTYFWTNLPYTHGMDENNKPIEIVKYMVQPCTNNPISSHVKMGPNYLQEDIIKRANEGSICFDLKVQFFNKAKLRKSRKFSGKMYRFWKNTKWIENGGLEWPETALPFHHIARITVPKGSLPQDCGDRYVNTRVHAGIENLPIGSISRVRTYVEERSRANRMK